MAFAALALLRKHFALWRRRMSASALPMPLVAPVAMKTLFVGKGDAVRRDQIAHFTRFIFVSVRVAAEGKVIARCNELTKKQETYR